SLACPQTSSLPLPHASSSARLQLAPASASAPAAAPFLQLAGNRRRHAGIASCALGALSLRRRRQGDRRTALRSGRQLAELALRSQLAELKVVATRPPQSEAPAEKTQEISPRNGRAHVCTLIYLHGYSGLGSDYLSEESWTCLPWMKGGDLAPGLRTVLPTAPSMR
ncbi:unnamed protein product, partial [Polarella glacialis]